jgi:hypothetical protein
LPVRSPLLALVLVLLALPVRDGVPWMPGSDGRFSAHPEHQLLRSLPSIQKSGEGFLFVSGSGPVVGKGERRTYRVEVEPGIGVAAREFTDVAERILSDERGWTGAGDWALQRVDARGADIRIVLATPATVDRLCAQAGLDTHGEVSCWNGRFAALNIDRWTSGTKGFTGPRYLYRQYLLNHEFGHGLGYRHRACPRPGAPAPVMQQQTYATKPCRANGWPVIAA